MPPSFPPESALTLLVSQAWPLLVIVAVLILVKRLLSRRRPEVAYRQQKALLTPAERSFFGVLQPLLPPHHYLVFKVRLADIITPAGRLSRPDWQRAFNGVSAKHIDFLLCRSDDLSPVMAIELDDRSHQKKDRADRDGFVEAALKSAHLPLLRVDAQKSYTPSELREKLISTIHNQPVNR
ncbi:DUF2726 domain-containing protein [Prosthecobacter sp. SYSU 5D2]|uniref:DUF2726 domain-containing protein n=1 Tax=Prosthecobacter sp. SYSU 5D2 TaxID=3134134 RepID=UPI0031FE6B8C